MRRIVLGVGAMIAAVLLGYVGLHDHRVKPTSVRVAPAGPAGEADTTLIIVNAPPSVVHFDSEQPLELLAAANRGDVPSQATLCLRAMDASAASDDFATAAHWCSLAADGGNADSQARYGRLFQTGKGVAQDLEQAAVWYEKAAQQQNNYAMYMLGRMLIEKDDATDVARGSVMLQRAAALGNSNARIALERLGIEPEGRRNQQLLTR